MLARSVSLRWQRLASRSPRVAILGLLSLLCLFPARALAEPVLVVGFQEEGRPSPRARHAVMQFLQRMGEEVVTVSLSSQEQVCNQTDCLLRLADRYQAKRLIGGDITPNDKNYLIQVWIFDRTNQQPSMTEARCSECNSEQLYDTAARTAGQLLEGGAGAGTTPVAPPAPSAMASSGPEQQRSVQPTCRGPAYSFGRGVLIGAFAALTGAQLATGFTFLAYNGRTYATRSDGMGDITLDFTQAYRFAIGLSALPAVATLAAALPWHEILAAPRSTPALPRCQESGSRRWTFRRGLAAGSLGALAVAGLASSVALTAMNGSAYAYNNDGSAVSYNLRAHYSAGYALSAVMAAGLGLSLAIP